MNISILSLSQFQDSVIDSSSDGEVGEPLKQSSYYFQSKGEHRSSNMSQSAMGHSALFMDRLSATNPNLGEQPGPFSSKKMVHESDTPHSKDDDGINGMIGIKMFLLQL